MDLTNRDDYAFSGMVIMTLNRVKSLSDDRGAVRLTLRAKLHGRGPRAEADAARRLRHACVSATAARRD